MYETSAPGGGAMFLRQHFACIHICFPWTYILEAAVKLGAVTFGGISKS
jgi:hypothetical protein